MNLRGRNNEINSHKIKHSKAKPIKTTQQAYSETHTHNQKTQIKTIQTEPMEETEQTANTEANKIKQRNNEANNKETQKQQSKATQ